MPGFRPLSGNWSSPTQQAELDGFDDGIFEDVSVPFRGIGRLRLLTFWLVHYMRSSNTVSVPFRGIGRLRHHTGIHQRFKVRKRVSVPFRGIGRLRRRSKESSSRRNFKVSVPFRGIGRLRLQQVQQVKRSCSSSFRPLSGNWSSPTRLKLRDAAGNFRAGRVSVPFRGIGRLRQ